MNYQPDRLQRRRQRHNIDVEVDRPDAKKDQSEADNVDPQKADLLPELHEQEHSDNERCRCQCEAEHVRPRCVAGGEATEHDTRGVEDKPDDGESHRGPHEA